MPSHPLVVTSRFDRSDSHTLMGYEATGGYQGLRRALEMAPDAIAQEVRTAGLTGRSGGAAFLTAQKWSLLVDSEPRYLVINGDESEPGFCKDRALMERDPHQLIEGSLICARAIGASQIFLYVRGEMALAQERIASALVEAYDAGYVGADVLGTGWSIDIVLHWGAGAYIVGEETGLIESLEGKRAFPRTKPPYYPTTYGLYMQPTVVNNVETMSVLPWIVLNGGAAFAALGENRSLGTRMFSLSGHVNRPGNYEVELAKLSFRELFESPDYGGGIRNGNALKAFIIGASFPWLGPEHLDLKMDIDATPPAGAPLGSGIVVMDETTCSVRAAWRLVKFYAHESCGQCTPCREGGSWLEKIMYRIESGAGRMEDLDLLMDVCDTISPAVQWPFKWPPSMTTICALGPSIPPSIVSALGMFRDE
ncbi:MAG TPA: NADH-ubiquinone oxidoreductase-F iron-sulfur binding region domain-containing protein, partial [Acidimicrobiales bacterium]